MITNQFTSLLIQKIENIYFIAAKCSSINHSGKTGRKKFCSKPLASQPWRLPGTTRGISISPPPSYTFNYVSLYIYIYLYILGASEVSANLYCNSRTSVLGRLRDYLRLLMKRSVYPKKLQFVAYGQFV